LLSRVFAADGVRVTRIASGVPHGGDLEFADRTSDEIRDGLWDKILQSYTEKEQLVGREVLERVSADVVTDPRPQLLRLANVSHLATHVEAWLPVSAPSALALALLLHPTAAVGGTPRADALEMIRRLEAAPRGRYAGPVGWVDANGDGEFAIALRCAQVTDNVARLWAGAGIVADSDPDSEVAETTAKFDAVLSALV